MRDLNQYALNQSTAPTSEPVTLDEVQLHLRVTDNTEDNLINNLIATARAMAEEYTGRQLMTATWDLYLDRWPYGADPILLPRSPVQSVTSITYLDADGASQTWSSSSYALDQYTEPARINLAYDNVYPSARYIGNSIRVRYVSGYTSAALVPQPIKAAMLLMIASLYGGREDSSEMPTASRNLLDAFRVGDEFTCYGQASYGTW